LLVMARAWPDDHRRPVGELDARVNITVVPGPRGPTLRERMAPVPRRRAIGCLAAATVAAGALVAGISLTGRGGASNLLPTTVLPNTVLYPTYLRDRNPTAPHRASAYPLRCLKLLIALHDPSLMNAAFDWNLPCGRARGPNTLIAVPARSARTPRGPPSARSHPPGRRVGSIADDGPRHIQGRES
jgi:hypothetical protein